MEKILFRLSCGFHHAAGADSAQLCPLQGRHGRLRHHKGFFSTTTKAFDPFLASSNMPFFGRLACSPFNPSQSSAILMSNSPLFLARLSRVHKIFLQRPQSPRAKPNQISGEDEKRRKRAPSFMRRLANTEVHCMSNASLFCSNGSKARGKTEWRQETSFT